MTELTISITELRNRFDKYMRRLKSGEVIVVTKYGKPIAQFTPTKLLYKGRRPPLSETRKKVSRIES